MSASAIQWNAAARADAVHRGDHRLPHVVLPCGEAEGPLLDRLAVALHPLAVGGELGDVDAGLERAPFTGVHDHPDFGVGVEGLPRDLELVAHQRAHRVELLGPVVDQPADRTDALQLQRLELRIRHERTSHAGSALLGERARPFFLVRMAPHRHELRRAGTGRVGETGLERAPQRALGRGHRGRRILRDLLGERLRLRAELLGRDHLRTDPERVRTRRGHAFARPHERHAQDGFHRRLLRQRDRLVHAHLPDRDVRIEERGVLARDDDVGIGDEVQAAAGAHTVDGRDHRLPHLVVPAR